MGGGRGGVGGGVATLIIRKGWYYQVVLDKKTKIVRF